MEKKALKIWNFILRVMGRYWKVLGRKVLNESTEFKSTAQYRSYWLSQKEIQLTPVPGISSSSLTTASLSKPGCKLFMNQTSEEYSWFVAFSDKSDINTIADFQLLIRSYKSRAGERCSISYHYMVRLTFRDNGPNYPQEHKKYYNTVYYNN